MSLDRFEIISTISNTLQDSLKLVKKKEDGKLYTLKSVKIGENNEKEKELFFNELRILVPLTHKNIILYKEAFYDKETKTLNMVIEYVDGGDLSMKIKEAKQRRMFFKEKIIWQLFIQILEGINYLHKKFIIHRDLKTSNIYLTKKGRVKIGGLNVGKNIENLGMAITQIGTPYFTAPEIWEQKPYDYKCDIWSLGCILYELTTLQVPFLGLNMQELYQNITHLKYKPIPNIFSKELKEIINLILNKNPKERPSTNELLNNKIILKKMNELNIKSDFNDEYSYINKTLNKIVDDYNNKIKKLESSHIIYRKIEKDSENLSNLKEKISDQNLKHIYANFNNNIKKEKLLNDNRTNSESNKLVNKNNINKKIKMNSIKNNKSYNNKNNNFEGKNDTDYNSRINENYVQSALNQRIYSSMLNNNYGKECDNNKNKGIDIIDNYRNNNKIDIQKENIQNIKNKNKMCYINIPNSYSGQRINSLNKLNNYNIYKKLKLDEIVEKKTNLKDKIIIDKNIHNYNSFNKNNLFIKSNNSNYKNNNKNINNKIYNTDNPSKKNLKENSSAFKKKLNYYTRIIKNKINNNDINNKQKTNIKYNFLNNDNHSNNYIDNNKLIRGNNSIHNKSNINSSQIYRDINDKNNKKYIDNQKILDISKKFHKNKSNEGYFNYLVIKKIKSMTSRISPEKIDEKEKMKYIINKQKNNNGGYYNNKKIVIKNMGNKNIINNNKIITHNNSRPINRNIDNKFYDNKTEKLSNTYENINPKPNNKYINNIMLYQKNT